MSKVGNKLNHPGDIILRPRLTEKASALSGATGPVYTFEVSTRANKDQIAGAIKTLFKIKPIKINVINLPAKVKVNRGRLGRTRAIRKAMVYLKAGDKIE